MGDPQAGIDMLILHLDLPTAMTKGTKDVVPWDSSCAAVAWLDTLLGLMRSDRKFKQGVLLSIVFALHKDVKVPHLQAGGMPCARGNDDALNHRFAGLDDQQNVDLSKEGGTPHGLRHESQDGVTLLRPRQSFETEGLTPVTVDTAYPMLLVQCLPGVIRKDACVRCSVEECAALSGMLCILASRLMSEIAYKIGRASKYGA